MRKVDSTKFFFKILCGLICIDQISTKCTQQNEEIIHNCVLPLKQYAENLGQNHKTSRGVGNPLAAGVGPLLPVFQDGDIFENLCDVVARFEYCIRFAKKSCPEHVVVRLMTVSYGYLCNEGKIDFLANANCLTKLDQIPDIQQCHKMTMNSIVSVNEDSSVNIVQKISQTCRWLNHFSGCIQSRIVADCGLKAWTIIHRVLKDTATTLMPNCLFSSHNVLPSSKKGQQQQSRTMINDRQQSPYTTYGNNTIQSTNKYDINFVGNKDRTSLEARRNARLNNNGRNSSNDHLIKSHLLFVFFVTAFYSNVISQ